MSWLPVYNAWVIMIFLLSVFLWKLFGVLLFGLAGMVSLIYLAKESITAIKHYASGFWLFIASEVIAFGTLFTLCLWMEEGFVAPLSEFMELPFLGCFILTGSSITLTTYHHYLGSALGRPFLLMTIVLGWCFIMLQVFEFYGCQCDITYCIYQSVCFCTVGLHFTHVLGGVVVLMILFWVGDGNVSRSNIDFIVWYWHFVDYIWLFVFLIIYVS